MLPDKFVAGGIITKLPPSWRNFATLLKHKRQEFSVPDLIGTFDVEEKARAKDTRARGIEGGSSANLVQKKNFHSHNSRTRASLMVKKNLMGRTRLCNTQTSRRRMTRRKVFVMWGS